MKPLKPSMREKKRYLLVSGKNLRENIEKAIFNFIGILGSSRIGLKFIKNQGDSVIISVNRNSLDELRASLCIYQEKIKITKVSGSLKGLKGK